MNKTFAETMELSVFGMYNVMLTNRYIRKIGFDMERAAIPAKFHNYIIQQTYLLNLERYYDIYNAP